jgi:hypothetical protein
VAAAEHGAVKREAAASRGKPSRSAPEKTAACHASQSTGSLPHARLGGWSKHHAGRREATRFRSYVMRRRRGCSGTRAARGWRRRHGLSPAASRQVPHLTSPTPGPQPAPSPQAETVDVSTRPLVVVEAVAPHPPRPRPPRLRLPLSPPPPTAYKYLPRTRHGLTLRSAAPLHFLLLPPAPAPVSPVSTHVSAEAEELPCRSEKSARPSRLPPGDSFGRPNPQGVAAGGGRRAGVRPRSAAHEQRTRERGNKEVSPPPACCAPVPILGIAFSLCSACFLNSWYCSCAAALLRIIDR